MSDPAPSKCWWQASRWRDADAEIERLRAENKDLRRWKAMDKPLTAAMAIVNKDMERLRAREAELVAALREIADSVEGADTQSRMTDVECPSCRARRDNCRLCDGSGVVSEQQARDWPEVG